MLFPHTDNVLPALICPVDITTYADGDSSVRVEWTAPIPTDNSGYIAFSNSSHTPGSTFAIGYTWVVYAAWDRSGNKATCSFTVIVIGELMLFV